MISRCLCVFFFERSALFILKVECASGTLFLNIRREVVLVGLKSTNQSSAHWCIVPKSELRVNAAVLGFSTII